MMKEKNNSPAISLAFAPAGSKLLIVGNSGGLEFQRRIASLGIYPDEEIEIIERRCHGNFIVKVKGTRLAIGYGMTKKIKVQVIQ